MYPLGAELVLVHVDATDLDANAISVATSGSTPPGAVLLSPVTNSVTSSTKDALSAGTPGPVSWKETRSKRGKVEKMRGRESEREREKRE